jgi:hypothetical protein
MAYQAFLIAPFETGLQLNADLWLRAQDAFSSIVNGHIHNGAIEKRAGYDYFGQMVHGTVITAATTANPAVFTVTTIGSISDGDTANLSGLSGGTWSTLNSANYTIQNVAGATFTLEDTNGNPVDGSGLGAYTASSGTLNFYTKYRIMGIFRYISSQNARETLIADTKRVAIYDIGSSKFISLMLRDTANADFPENDVFSSSDTDFIWSANWQNAGVNNRVYFTNGKAWSGAAPGTDGILFYDDGGNYVKQFRPVVRSSGSPSLYGCKLIFAMRNRLLVLYTYEDSGIFPQRARWCAFNDPSNWNDDTPGGGGFVDAPTGEQIISAQQLQDFIIVQMTNSVWSIKPTSDPALPFRWEKINSYRSCDGKMATVGFDRYVIGAGQRGITATDATQTQRIDDKIKEFINTNVNGAAFDKIFMARDYQFNRTWMLYAEQTEQAEVSDDPTSALIFDEESKSWSTYQFTFKDTETGSTEQVVDLNVIGYGQTNEDLTALDIIAPRYPMPDDPDEDADATAFQNETALDFFWDSDEELFLAGNRSGLIYQLQKFTTDNGNPIDFYLESAGWNPFKEKSECQFGYIDLYLDTDQYTNLVIEFCTDDNENPYASQILDCLPNLYFLAKITDISLTDPLDPTQGITVQAPNHGLATDDLIYMYGIVGMLQANDTQYQITVVDLNNFIIDVDATNFDDYLGGGNVYRNKFYRTQCWKRAYAGGIGYEHFVKISSTGNATTLRILALKPYFRPRGRRILG